MADPADARRPMDVQADQAGLRASRLAGVDAHAHANLGFSGPGVAGQAALGLDRRKQGASSRRERVVQAVPCRALLGAILGTERVAEQPMVVSQDRCIALAQRLEQLGRALDVREDERDGAGGDAGHDRWTTATVAPASGGGRGTPAGPSLVTTPAGRPSWTATSAARHSDSSAKASSSDAATSMHRQRPLHDLAHGALDDGRVAEGPLEQAPLVDRTDDALDGVAVALGDRHLADAEALERRRCVADPVGRAREHDRSAARRPWWPSREHGRATRATAPVVSRAGR